MCTFCEERTFYELPILQNRAIINISKSYVKTHTFLIGQRNTLLLCVCKYCVTEFIYLLLICIYLQTYHMILIYHFPMPCEINKQCGAKHGTKLPKIQ